MDARPRVAAHDDSLLVSLRGVNLNPGAHPEDMVGIRIWADKDRIITVRHRRLMAVQELRERLARGHGPKTTGEFLARIADGMIDRMGPVVSDLEDRVDALEDEVLDQGRSSLRSELSDIRRVAITLRRYLAPQREAMSRLLIEEVSWLSAMDKTVLREVADRTTRYVEDLDSARERAAVVQEELAARLADQMNRTMYVLTVVAAILLPPSLLTGLLGINVGGMPGVDSDWSFAVVALAIVAIGIVEFFILRWLKWI
jgi:zinc transporter